MTSAIFTQKIMQKAGESNTLRTGQVLFNCLPADVALQVSGALWDPFHREWSEEKIFEWIDNHLIFNGDQIVGLFNGDHLLWYLDPTKKEQ